METGFAMSRQGEGTSFLLLPPVWLRKDLEGLPVLFFFFKKKVLGAWTLFLNPPEILLRNSCCVHVRFTEPNPALPWPCCPAPMPAQPGPGQTSRVWTHFLLPGVLELSLMCPVCPHTGSPTFVICLHPHRVLRRCSAAGIQSAGL